MDHLDFAYYHKNEGGYRVSLTVPVSIGHTGMRSGSVYSTMQVSWQWGLLISKELCTEGIEKGKFFLSLSNDIGAPPFSLCSVT